MDRCSRRTGVAEGWLLIAIILCSFSASDAFAESDEYARRLNEARALLQQQKAHEALAAFQALLAEQPSLPASIGAARASAMTDQPQEALRYYRQALGIAEDEEERNVARFGIARMLLWLEQYQDAEVMYTDLASRPLSTEDHSFASAGLMRSLSFQNKPIKAYRSASSNTPLLAPEKLELARAALWSGLPDKAAEIIDQGIAVEPDTRMARELGALQSEVQAETANPLDFHAEFTSDSDDLRTMKSELAAAVRPFPAGTAGLVAQHQGFTRHEQSLTMNGLQARVSSRTEDRLLLSIQGGPAAYGDWRTALWSGSAVFRPDDNMRYETYASREAVETFPAFERHIRFDTAGLGATYSPAGFVLAASLYRQTFSDDNRRLGVSGALGVPVSEPLGLSVRLRARYFGSGRTDTVGYFNPDRFMHEQLLFELNRLLGQNWRLYAAAGPGLQRITPGERSTTALAELSIQGALYRSLAIGIDCGYSSSAIASSSGYRRQYAALSLSHPW